MIQRYTTTSWSNFTGRDGAGRPFLAAHEVLGLDGEGLIFYEGCVEPLMRHALEVVVAGSVQEMGDVLLVQIVSSCVGVMTMLACVALWILPELRRLEDELTLSTPLVFRGLLSVTK